MRGLYLSLSIAILSLFWGCEATLRVPSQPQVQIDKSLPKIELTQNGVVVEMNAIAFEWKPIKSSEVEGIKIYKSVAESNTSVLLATIPNRYATHYVDLDVKPDTKYSYYFRTFSGKRLSPKSKSIVLYSKPPLPSVAWIYARSALPRMAKVIWRPHTNEAVHTYIIERKTFPDDKWREIDRLNGRLQAEYIDTPLKDKHVYYYRVRVETFEGIRSTPSEIVKVVTKPLPPTVTGLKATIDLPRKIKLHWDKSNYKDFERYYLYRSPHKDGHYELIAKLYNNSFVDKVGKDGVEYFYKVSQKDSDGLESNKDDYIVMGATLPKPQPPKPKEARFDGSVIYVEWFKVDPRSKSYVVERTAKLGWFNKRVTRYKTKETSYVDRDIQPGVSYTYRIYALDEHGIPSLASEELKVEVKELKVLPKKAAKKPSKALKKPSKADASKGVVVSPIDDLELDTK